jgi:hypothetical protein
MQLLRHERHVERDVWMGNLGILWLPVAQKCLCG